MVEPDTDRQAKAGRETATDWGRRPRVVFRAMARWMVDGMNVIGSRPDGWWRDRDGAVVKLVRRLAAFAASSGDEVTVVFDGRRPSGLGDEDAGDVAVVFAGRGASADDEIARRVAADPDPASLVVVTSDAELASRVQAAGASVVGSGQFRRRLDEGQPAPGAGRYCR
jgi:predicted RNA-binding protein with PIN domain